MSETRAYPRLRFAHVIVAALAGCIFVAASWYFIRYLPARAATNDAERFRDLRSVGEAYLDFQRRNAASPAGPDDLEPLLREQHPEAWSRLSQGEYEVVWNAAFEPERSIAEVVLAHEVSNYDGDSLVVFADCHVATVDAEDVWKLPKVKSDIRVP